MIHGDGLWLFESQDLERSVYVLSGRPGAMTHVKDVFIRYLTEKKIVFGDKMCPANSTLKTDFFPHYNQWSAMY